MFIFEILLWNIFVYIFFFGMKIFKLVVFVVVGLISNYFVSGFLRVMVGKDIFDFNI